MSLTGWYRRLLGRKPGRRVEVSAARPIRARYDAAQTTDDNSQHWALVDSYDADSANSLTVRSTLRKRSRHELENNGHGKGIELTQANYVVGRGPKLRMQTTNKAFNAAVEAAWNRWWKRVKGSRKLRTAVKAKVKSGEGFLVAKQNPGLRDQVKLDIVGIECDQFTTPQLPYNEPNRIDGIKFDEFGNPLYYDLLTYHPGSGWSGLLDQPQQVDARYVFHLFREDRPGQHRGIPEVTSTLGLFAAARRFREATIAAAETAADHAALLYADAPASEEPDEMRPFSTMPIEKRMLTMMPYKWRMEQLRAEHPATTYPEFNRINTGEEARPLSMSYNIAACDSSGYSFSGGKLDHLTYFVSVDVEQADIEDLLLDPLFELWFEEAVLEYRGVPGWAISADVGSDHGWDWPARPQIDEQKTASARETNLGTGVASLRRIYAEDGYDFEDELPAMAEDYGKTPEEMREALFQKHFAAKAPESKPTPEDTDDGEDKPPPRNNGNGRTAKANGHGRVLV
jgi:capsid protein